MRGGCLGQLFSWALIGAVLLWFLTAPESAAGLVNGFVGLVSTGGEALGRFITAINLDIF